MGAEHRSLTRCPSSKLAGAQNSRRRRSSRRCDNVTRIPGRIPRHEWVDSSCGFHWLTRPAVFSIANGSKQNETWEIPRESTGVDTYSDVQETSEVVELYLAIEDGISNLFQLSMIIRKKPETDEYIKAASRYLIDPLSDIIHVGDKYQKVKVGKEWLQKRLGEAITRRRQYLQYRKEHQIKLEQVHEHKLGADGKTMWSGEKASTYHGNNDIIEYGQLTAGIQGVRQSSSAARTEYADSSKGRGASLAVLRTPPLPKKENGTRVKYGEHFECPLCRRMVRFDNKPDWKYEISSLAAFKSSNLV